MNRIEQFWNAYYQALVAQIDANPQDYALRPNETPAGYASATAAKMQRAVELAGTFGAVNYATSKAFRAAAKAVGVAFNKSGLDSLYAGRA